jgi:hypothetical protein
MAVSNAFFLSEAGAAGSMGFFAVAMFKTPYPFSILFLERKRIKKNFHRMILFYLSA